MFAALFQVSYLLVEMGRDFRENNRFDSHIVDYYSNTMFLAMLFYRSNLNYNVFKETFA